MDLDIVNPQITDYVTGLLPDRDPMFVEMEKKAEWEDFPLIGPQVGTLLEILTRAIKAKRIMELGSGFGYSGLWFARALPADGYLLLTDFEEKNRLMAEAYFERVGKKKLMEFRVGDALKILGEEKEPYDIIFNDVDKELYPQLIKPVYGLLRKGGLFVTDNTLWYGRVAGNQTDAPTDAIREFNKRLMADEGFLTLQLPLRDGVAVSLKIGN
jgi:caffeoyl-CoA O-methyltransferase